MFRAAVEIIMSSCALWCRKRMVRKMLEMQCWVGVVLAVLLVSEFAGCGKQIEPTSRPDGSVGDAVSMSNDTPPKVEALSRGYKNPLDAGHSDEPVESTRDHLDTSGGSEVIGNGSTVMQVEVPHFYTVSAYDVERDPSADLIMTISKAKREKKRILLQVGGDWCSWCGRLAEFMKNRESVRRLLDQHFLIMKIASQSKYADVFLADYPEINAYPFIYVLSPNGELLHSQDMEKLELGEGYDEDAVVGFLKAWVASSAELSSDAGVIEVK